MSTKLPRNGTFIAAMDYVGLPETPFWMVGRPAGTHGSGNLAPAEHDAAEALGIEPLQDLGRAHALAYRSAEEARQVAAELSRRMPGIDFGLVSSEDLHIAFAGDGDPTEESGGV